MSAGPQPIDIQSLAYWNPRVALALMQGDVFEPIIFNIRAEFVTGGPSFIEAAIDTPAGNVAQDTWITDVVHTVEPPFAFAGSIFRSQYVWYNALIPFIDVELTVFGAQRYDITPRPTPIQNVARDFQCCWPGGWTLFYQQNVRAIFRLTRTLIPTVSNVGEFPYKVILSLRGWQMGTQDLAKRGVNEARKILAEKFGIIPKAP